jgi:broad specificity phosphatase PhoE
MPSLYLIRHGETDFNRQNIVQGGGIDSDLNATGRQQGRLFFERHRDTHFDLVGCTALKRTYQTIESYEELGHDIQVFPGLNELNWGRLEGATGTEEIRMEFDRINGYWNNGDLDARIEGGESPNEAWARLSPALEEVIAVLPPDGKALLCIHGRVMRIVLAQLLGYGMQHMNLFPHHNTALNLLHARGDVFWAERLNDLSHLPS